MESALKISTSRSSPWNTLPPMMASFFLFTAQALWPHRGVCSALSSSSVFVSCGRDQSLEGRGNMPVSGANRARQEEICP
eukprot:452588-Prorocentrum_minimum.AAC.1